MNVKRPWLRYFNADDSGAGGTNGGGTGSAAAAAGAGAGTGAGAAASGTDDTGAGGTGGTDGGGAGGADTGGDDGKGGKAAVLADLARERDARQTLDTENQTLKSELQALKDQGLTPEQKAERDAQQTAGRVGELETENGTLKSTNSDLAAENLRLRVAIDVGIPANWVDRLRGSTEEEVRADAQSVKQDLRLGSSGEYTAGVGHRGSDNADAKPGMGNIRLGYESTSRT
ncbi:MAG: hypothetical protein U5O16_00980 [Rhodococcus sp. (in: high G+C Gram-positive bacteria)]|uniref:hypothetical protein n=1 Tax=Rhodococcus sp. TaxID=1831 RepID=UPI002ADABB09|nr:hypothetical protein [Rhodococcus sp. (in: high G+C Gram-positive bacteria)]